MAIREQLRPYITEQYRQAATAGTPVIRPLFFDFTSDASAVAVDDQMMFGPRFLVAPQMIANASMPVCLSHWACYSGRNVRQVFLTLPRSQPRRVLAGASCWRELAGLVHFIGVPGRPKYQSESPCAACAAPKGAKG